MNTSLQEINKTIEDPSKARTVLINYCSRQGVTDFPEMKEVYDTIYTGYDADAELINALRSLSEGIKITVVMGTWCGDSKLQVPRFFKIIDLLDITEKDLVLICTDGEKKTENHLLDNLNIERVPTFIFYREEKEIGRIIESPQTTLENDMLNILKK